MVGETAEQFKQLANGIEKTEYSQDILPIKILVDESVKDIVNENTKFAVAEKNNEQTVYCDLKNSVMYSDPVTSFEQSIAAFFNAPFAVCVDSCTHGIELCLRMTEARYINVPRRTYLSIPMLADKLGIHLQWTDEQWQDYYRVNGEIYDAAVLWRRNSYIPGSFMCLSFQYQKHLSLGRGGMILCPDKDSYDKLKRMSYDGRLPGIPWREQDVDRIGYHYYMTPETAQLGLDKLQAAINTPPRQWLFEDWPDISKFKVFDK